MRRKLFQIFKCVILLFTFSLILSWGDELYDSFIHPEEYEQMFSYLDGGKGYWHLASIENYRKSNLIDLTVWIIWFGISLFSVWKNDRFWNACFWIFFGFIAFCVIFGWPWY